MSDTQAPQPDGTKAPAQKRGNELGINKYIYGAGTTVRDGFISLFAIFTVVFVTLRFGGNLKPIKAATDGWERFHKGGGFQNLITKYVGEKAGELFGQVKNIFKGGIVATSFGIAWFLSHFTALPGAAVGAKKAQTAIDKHNTLLDEKDQLVETNKILIAENNQLKKQLSDGETAQPAATEQMVQTAPPQQKPAASFTSRVSAQPETVHGLGAFL